MSYLSRLVGDQSFPGWSAGIWPEPGRPDFDHSGRPADRGRIDSYPARLAEQLPAGICSPAAGQVILSRSLRFVPHCPPARRPAGPSTASGLFSFSPDGRAGGRAGGRNPGGGWSVVNLGRDWPANGVGRKEARLKVGRERGGGGTRRDGRRSEGVRVGRRELRQRRRQR